MQQSVNMDKNAVKCLIMLFNGLFKPSFETQLCRGGHDPVYLPKSEARQYSEIQFAHGSFTSALHEISHWCLAGTERRKLVDYGYWYEPQRSSKAQLEFYQAEVAPQALELLFSIACGIRFFVSADNLIPGGSEASQSLLDFKTAILKKARSLLDNQKIPARALILMPELYQNFYSWPNLITQTTYLPQILENELTKLEQSFDF